MKKKLFGLVLMTSLFAFFANSVESTTQTQREQTTVISCNNTGGTCPNQPIDQGPESQ